MKKVIVSLVVAASFLPIITLAKPAPSATITCHLNPLYGTGGYQPYFLCTTT